MVSVLATEADSAPSATIIGRNAPGAGLPRRNEPYPCVYPLVDRSRRAGMVRRAWPGTLVEELMRGVSEGLVRQIVNLTHPEGKGCPTDCWDIRGARLGKA